MAESQSRIQFRLHSHHPQLRGLLGYLHRPHHPQANLESQGKRMEYVSLIQNMRISQHEVNSDSTYYASLV